MSARLGTMISGLALIATASPSNASEWKHELAPYLAYRHIDVDYEDGNGENYFKYDMAISGPAAGVVFTF